MPVAGVPVGVQRGQVQRHHARPVRAVDQHLRPGLLAKRHQPLQRQHQRAGRGDVVEHDEPRLRSQLRRHRFDDRVGTRSREGKQRLDHRSTGAPGHMAHRVAHRAVAVVEHQDLVAGPKAQRAQHGVAARGRIVDEADVLRLGAHEGGEPRGRLAQQRRQLDRHEARRLRFQLAAPVVLGVAHRHRHGAERAVVDGQETGFEQEPVADGCSEHGHGVRPGPWRGRTRRPAARRTRSSPGSGASRRNRGSAARTSTAARRR